VSLGTFSILEILRFQPDANFTISKHYSADFLEFCPFKTCPEGNYHGRDDYVENSEKNPGKF